MSGVEKIALVSPAQITLGRCTSCLRNIEMNALGLLYPASRAAAVTFSPEASSCVE